MCCEPRSIPVKQTVQTKKGRHVTRGSLYVASSESFKALKRNNHHFVFTFFLSLPTWQTPTFIRSFSIYGKDRDGWFLILFKIMWWSFPQNSKIASDKKDEFKQVCNVFKHSCSYSIKKEWKQTPTILRHSISEATDTFSHFDHCK